MTYSVYNCNYMVLQYIFSFEKRFREKYTIRTLVFFRGVRFVSCRVLQESIFGFTENETT